MKLRYVRDLAQDPSFLLCPLLLWEMGYVGGMDIRVIYTGGTISFTFIISKFPQKKIRGKYMRETYTRLLPLN